MDDRENIETIGDRLAKAAVPTANSELIPGAGDHPVKEGDEREAVCEACGATFGFVVAGRTDSRGRFNPFPGPRLCEICRRDEERREREERQHQLLNERFSRFDWEQGYFSDFGTRLARAHLGSFVVGDHNRAAFGVAREWLSLEAGGERERESRRPNLIIVGPIGAGKSYLAACLYRELRIQMEPAFWINAATLIAEIRRGFSDRKAAVHAGSKMEAAEKAPVLFVDDLGKVHPGKDVSWVEEQFYALIDARYREELPTIVTTEWKSDALAERVGESVVSRLMDGAMIAGIKRPATPYRRLAPCGSVSNG